VDLRQLRYFVTVAAERNFNKAAERLHIAQPPLSRAIQQLEAELGAALIDRTARPLKLTTVGNLFY
jgi:DNA-binding transcriptional LysR family regulator